MTNYAVEVANALLDVGAVGFTPDAPITFKSGIKSPVYVDNRVLPGISGDDKSIFWLCHPGIYPPEYSLICCSEIQKI